MWQWGRYLLFGLSVFGMGGAIQKSIFLQLALSLNDPGEVFPWALGGIIVGTFLIFLDLWEGKRFKPAVWLVVLVTVLGLFHQVRPPFFTQFLIEEARKGSPDAGYWFQLYTNPGEIPHSPYVDRRLLTAHR